MPKSWLSWQALSPKLVFGWHAHRRWNYTGGAQPFLPVKWYIRAANNTPYTETIANLWRRFVATLTSSELPWITEAREAAEEAAKEGGEQEDAASEHNGTSSSVRHGRALSTYKRRIVVVGITAGFICWAVFTWCVDASVLTCAVCLCRSRRTVYFPHAGSSLPTACSSTGFWAMGCVQRSLRRLLPTGAAAQLFC